jgi:S-DNA-T family DNA segregation ATPase FtsK/SpoIIIE
VHLLLATQHPTDPVTADIRAETDLRIALRVTDPAESIDVIGDPAAAGIARSTPGRCYVRSGVAAPRAVQSARVGGHRPGAAAAHTHAVVLPWADLGRPLAHSRPADEAPASTDLRTLVAAVREAAERTGIDGAPPPWLPPLPDSVTLDELPAVFADGDDVPPLAFGLTDLPAARSRGALALDLVGGGHLYAAGSSRSGRSTVLRTLAGALASSCAPADVHLYAIDCGDGALLPLVALPHCGTTVGRDHPERVERLLGRLHAEVARRRQVLAATGFASLAEQRAAVKPGERLPWMLLMLDDWDGFVAAFDDRLVDSVVRLLREGAAAGLRAVFTGDRSGFDGRVSTVFDTHLILRMADPADYAHAGIDERRVPARMPPGRVIEADEGGTSIRESQVALLDRDPSGTAQVAALQRLAREAEAAYGRPLRDLGPLHVDELRRRREAGVEGHGLGIGNADGYGP